MYNGIIFSDAPPDHVTGYAWVKRSPDGSKEWHHFDKDTQSWVLDIAEAASAPLVHSHPELGDTNFTGKISVGGVAGLTGSRLIPGVGTLTFTKGLLTGFTPA